MGLGELNVGAGFQIYFQQTEYKISTRSTKAIAWKRDLDKLSITSKEDSLHHHYDEHQRLTK